MQRDDGRDPRDNDRKGNDPRGNDPQTPRLRARLREGQRRGADGGPPRDPRRIDERGGEAGNGDGTRRLFKVLAIDGGGMRGIIPARMVQALEERLGAPVSECFDLVAGTSTGGLLALGLTRPDPLNPGRPLYGGRDLIELYRDEGPRIFDGKFLGGVRNLFGPRYSNEALFEILDGRFGRATMQDGMTNLLITSYDMGGGRAHLLRNRLDPKLRAQDRNYRMRDAAMATSAAPTFFPPFDLYTVAPKTEGGVTPRVPDRRERFLSIDGGVYAANPALLAALEADDLIGDRNMDIMVVSLGTGLTNVTFETRKQRKQLKGWGAIGWISPGKRGGPNIIRAMMDGQADTADQQLRMLLSSDYSRFDAPLRGPSAAMDDASEENIAALIQFAEDMARQNEPELDRLAARLRADLRHGPIGHGLAGTSRAAETGRLLGPDGRPIRSDGDKPDSRNPETGDPERRRAANDGSPPESPRRRPLAPGM